MPVELRKRDPQYLAQLYLQGEAAEQIERRLHLGHGKVWEALRHLGIPRRTRAACNRLWLSKTSTRWRLQVLTRAAHAACRGRIPSSDELQRRSESRARTHARTGRVIGRFENDLKQLLQRRGLTLTPQLPIGGYNLDLARLPIAVEVHVSANHPSTDRKIRKRTEHLRDLGWHVVYVWITAGFPLRGSGADKVITLYHFVKRLPAGKGKYWVIRGSGEYAFPRVYRGHRPNVLTPESLP